MLLCIQNLSCYYFKFCFADQLWVEHDPREPPVNRNEWKHGTAWSDVVVPLPQCTFHTYFTRVFPAPLDDEHSREQLHLRCEYTIRRAVVWLSTPRTKRMTAPLSEKTWPQVGHCFRSLLSFLLVYRQLVLIEGLDDRGKLLVPIWNEYGDLSAITPGSKISLDVITAFRHQCPPSSYHHDSAVMNMNGRAEAGTELEYISLVNVT
jgi:hypothetical protein